MKKNNPAKSSMAKAAVSAPPVDEDGNLIPEKIVRHKWELNHTAQDYKIKWVGKSWEELEWVSDEAM